MQTTTSKPLPPPSPPQKKKKKDPTTRDYKTVFATISSSSIVNKDSTLPFGQSDLDLRCPQGRMKYFNQINPLPDMPIFGSSSSAENKDIMSKNMDKWGYNYLMG